MKQRRMVARRVAIVASGLAMATSLGLTGAGVASAAVPALEIKPGATWSISIEGDGGSGCSLATFGLTSNTFVTNFGGDSGTFAGGGSTINMPGLPDQTLA